MGLRSNGEASSRRNKYHMGETVRRAGVRAAKQQLCTTIADLEAFPAELERIKPLLKCVVKPVQSAGADDVYLCGSRSEALAAFKSSRGSATAWDSSTKVCYCICVYGTHQRSRIRCITETALLTLFTTPCSMFCAAALVQEFRRAKST